MADELELRRLAARQHGLATRTQLIARGWTPRQIEYAARIGRWERVAPEVYDIVPGSFDPARAVHAAVLASRGWASHRSAAWLRGFLERPPARPEILVPEGRLPRGLTAIVHRSRHLDRTELRAVDGIRCTSPARTLLDLASVVDAEALEHALGRAVTGGTVRVRTLHAFVERSLVGRPGAAALREALTHYVDRTAATQSLLEVIVERAVRRGGIEAPQRQHLVVVARRRFRIDLAWPRQMLAVEADGYANHSTPRAKAADAARQNLLVLAGWRFLRYDWLVARYDPRRVEAEVRAVLRRAS